MCDLDRGGRGRAERPVPTIGGHARKSLQSSAGAGLVDRAAGAGRQPRAGRRAGRRCERLRAAPGPRDRAGACRLAVVAAGAAAVAPFASRRPGCSNGRGDDAPPARSARARSTPPIPAALVAQWLAGERAAAQHRGRRRAWPATSTGWSTTCAGTSRTTSARVVGKAPARELAPRCGFGAGAVRDARAAAARRPLGGDRAAAPGGGDAAPMRHLARLRLHRVTVLRFGLDELALSGFRAALGALRWCA